MTPLFLYNTLSRTKEEFKSIKPGSVGLYTCGPTVYNFAHIGNLRAYLFEDFLQKTLEYNGYQVKRVMNVTDVGHLTGDMDMGEDKMEKGAAREGKSAWDIAAFYLAAFRRDLAALHIKEPNIWCKATDYIPEQIAMIVTLEQKGYTYQIGDGIYFDTSQVKDYNKLSHLPLAELREGARVEINPDKKSPTDFALWKFSPAGARRQMEWPSPWGLGFPGWHIECSAMSLKFLTGQLDIHCGGIDHINIHHTNEIAQSEAATGQKFFNYWLHGAFLNIPGGKKMAKSADNFLTLENALIKQGLSPLAYRFAALQTHYRKSMEYSLEGMKQAQAGLTSLWEQVAGLGTVSGAVSPALADKFNAAINDDLNLPKALAVLASVFKSQLAAADKLATVLDFDRVLGLGLAQAGATVTPDLSLADLSADMQKLVTDREAARAAKDWAAADRLRDQLIQAGYILKDTEQGYQITAAK
jgi:cysteinyl-tRNA synthetase